MDARKRRDILLIAAIVILLGLLLVALWLFPDGKEGNADDWTPATKPSSATTTTVTDTSSTGGTETTVGYNRMDVVRNTLQIKKITVYDPHYHGGVDFSIYWQNTSDRTIDEVVFIVAPYDAEGNEITCEKEGHTEFQGITSGKVRPGATYGNGENTYWSNAWYSHDIERLEIRKITVIFAGGKREVIEFEEVPWCME